MSNTRKLTIISIFGAISVVLMMLEFSVPFVPGFLKFDFSDVPALIVSFATGPINGMLVCLLKNIIHLFMSHTGGAGEIANFILSTAFVLPAGFIYEYKKSKKYAILGSYAGAFISALISLPINYFITYPVYEKIFMPREAIVKMYSDILPAADTLLKALIIFNIPFTLIKGIVAAMICILIYKPLSPMIKGNR